jgi:repressor of nif and glnA expression
MSQGDIIDVLEKIKRPMSRGEIAKELNDEGSHVSHSIARLIKGRCIKIIEIDRNEALKRYKCKRRMRLYYV